MSYCTQADIEAQLSSDGVDLRLDDDPDAIDDVLDEADWDVKEALAGLFTAASIAASGWVRHKAKAIATHLLCTRRGNPGPGSVEQRYTEAKEKLLAIANGNYAMANAAGLVWSKAAVPQMSNVRPVLRPFPRTVIERNRSTGKAEGYPKNNEDPFDRTNVNLSYQI